MYNNGKVYGSSSAGHSYSPDRSRDIDRFNPSTRSNYSYSVTNRYYPTKQPIYTGSNGHYDGRGQWVQD